MSSNGAISTGWRVIGYGRQSEARPGENEDTSLSLESQETRYLSWCHEHGAVPLGMIRDHDLSGEDPDRPGIAELLDRVSSQKADAVWVFTLRRFSRDFVYQEITWRQLQKRGVKHLISELDKHVDDDFTRGIYGLMGQKQLQEQRAHVRAAFHERAKRGHHHGPAPYGYRREHMMTEIRRDGSTHERQTGNLIPVAEITPIIVEVYERVLAGASMLSIAWDFSRRGIDSPTGSPWHQGMIKHILTNPVYAGGVRLNGQIVNREAHAAVITWTQFDEAQRRLAEIVTVKRKHPGLVSWCEGLVEHSCGRRMYLSGIDRTDGNPATPSFGCGASYGAHTVRCLEPRRHIIVEYLETATRNALLADLSRVSSLSDAVAWANEAAGGRTADRARKALIAREETARDRHARHYEYWLSRKKKLPLAWMDAKDAELDRELAAIERDRAALPEPADVTSFAETAELLHGVATSVALASAEGMQRILMTLGIAVVTLDGVQIRYRPEIRPFIPSPALTPAGRYRKPRP